jgi:hypothetical protein
MPDHTATPDPSNIVSDRSAQGSARSLIKKLSWLFADWHRLNDDFGVVFHT